MRAAVLRDQKTGVRIEQVDLEKPREGEVRVQMVGAGACHSDYHRVSGHVEFGLVPYVLGHEGSGVVREVGSGVTTVEPGDHVILSLTAQCGRCRNCHAGRPNLCEWWVLGKGTLPGGRRPFTKDGVPLYADLATFAEETVVAESYLVKIRKDVPLAKACLIGCGVMTGVGAVLNRAKVETGSTVVVIGCGGVGMNVVQGAVLANAGKIIAVDKVKFKLDMAHSIGATHMIDASKEDPVKRVMEITDGGADYAFEVIGFPQTVRQAFDCIRPGGTCVMVGVPPKGGEVSVPGMPLFWDRTVMGTFYGAGRPRTDFPWMLDLYASGRLKLDELATKVRPIEEVNQAFDDMNKGVTVRTVFTFG
ncbi:MAG: Zn-dependent alcohol dehydrogenase [SAR202 cluster bacterium]|nr:Zn-dependent alcohol dehydrogenase [SAR202 cluster bacterium]